MEKTFAHDLLKELNESWGVINQKLLDLQGACPEQPFRACTRLLASIMSEMSGAVMERIYDEHPDLAPDWYRDGPPSGGPDIPEIALPTEASQALLTSFEAAYEKVQTAMQRVASLPDPIDVARVSLGLHIISVSICRARLSLLRAKTE